MNVQELGQTGHSQEKVSVVVKFAIGLVPVSDYLQQRYSLRDHFIHHEEDRLTDAEEILNRNLQPKEPFFLSDNPPATHDPLVVIARDIVRDVPLPQYLSVRHDVLETAIDHAAARRNEYEVMVGREKELEKATDTVMGLQKELQLTESLIAMVQKSGHQTA